MYKQAEKPKENKSIAVANSVAQKKGDGKQGLGFVDNRIESASQCKIQGIANDNRRGQNKQLIQKVDSCSDAHKSKQSEVMQLMRIRERTTGKEKDHDYKNPIPFGWEEVKAVATIEISEWVEEGGKA